MQVLNKNQIREKIIRLSYEILENNLDENTLVLAGINNNGFRFAELLMDNLKDISNKQIILSRIRLNPAKPLDGDISTNLIRSEIEGKTIIVVDDVANTGRTIFYAFKVYMDALPKKLEVAVLVDRKHKLFPIKVDYVGLSLATTVQEHIKANLQNRDEMFVSIE